MSCSSRLGTLFEKPHKWDSSHRSLLGVKEDQVWSEELVGSACSISTPRWRLRWIFAFLFFSFPPFEYRFDPTNPHSRTWDYCRAFRRTREREYRWQHHLLRLQGQGEPFHCFHHFKCYDENGGRRWRRKRTRARRSRMAWTSEWLCSNVEIPP